MSPMDYSKYPKNGKQLARDCKDQAWWSCQKCGMPHMGDNSMGSCLTVHHINNDPENPDPELEAICARCHLYIMRMQQYDSAHIGQMVLFKEIDTPQ